MNVGTEEAPDLLYTAVGRTVAALDRFTGRPVWQLKLPRLFKGNVSMLLPHAHELYVARGGYIYCLDRHTGEVLWERGVSSAARLTLMAVIKDAQEQQQTTASHHAAAETAAAAAAASG